MGLLMLQKSGKLNQLRWVVYPSLSHYLEGILHPRWLARFLNHQQDLWPFWGVCGFDTASRRHQISKVNYAFGHGIVAAKFGLGFEGPVRNV